MSHPGSVSVLSAPAKLTLSLRVLGLRPDGYHELDAEMVSIDLADTLEIDPAGEGLDVVARGVDAVPSAGPGNLVLRALAAVGRRAGVRLVKRIPMGGGLGGGSADAAAVLRWAGCHDPAVASSLGADVPFCVRGGRARVRGIGELVEPLPHEDRSYVLLVPPFGVDTAAAYRAWDGLPGDRRQAPSDDGNDLTAAAMVVEPTLVLWRDRLGTMTGETPRLAGSGSTWFVEGTPTGLGVDVEAPVVLGDRIGRLIAVRSLPAQAGSAP